MPENQLAVLDEVGLFHIPVAAIRGKDVVSPSGKVYVDFCQTSYLGLEFDPLLNDRGCAWTREWGAVPGWSRMEANAALYGEFEAKLGRFLGARRVLTLPTITITNFSLIPGIVQKGLVLTDKLVHTVVYEACRLARDHGATLRSFRHQDMADLERLLVEHRDLHPKLIAVDGVYSITTELAPMRELQALCARHDAFLYVDDAHGFGVLGRDPAADNAYGRTGNGCLARAGGDHRRTFYVAGFAKAFCAATAFATIPDDFQGNVHAFAMSYLFSNPSTPHTLGMCDAALELNEARGEALRATLRVLARRLVEGLRAEGLRVFNNLDQPVVFLEVGPLDDLLAVGQALDAGGVIPGYRAYPVVPADRCGLRFALTATHTPAHVDRVLEILRTCKDRMLRADA